MRFDRLIGGCAVALFATTFLLHAAAVNADENGDAFVDDAGNPTAVAEDIPDPPAGNEQDAAADNCEYRVHLEDDLAWAIYDVNGSRLFSQTGRWLQPVCNGSRREPFPEGGLVDPRAVAIRARSSVAIAAPPMNTSPSANGRLYTQLPTWLWLSNDWWISYAATATAGNVSATVSAAPVTAVWNMGDGHTVTCDGPGVEWQRGMADDFTSCQHTYRHSSVDQPNHSYPISVTVTFEVTWTSNTGQGGSLDDITRETTTTVEVGEIQGLETE